MTRTITDPSELDTLPAWAAVEDVLGVAWVRHPGTPDRADHWVSYYGDRLSAQRVAAEGPLTLLHDPSAPVVPSATREDVLDVVWRASLLDEDQSGAVAEELLARFTITPRTDR